MPNKPRLVLFILAIVLIFGTPLFFMIYKENVAYYVKEDYDRLSRLIFIPIVVLLAVTITCKSIKQDRKRNTLKGSEYLKQLPSFIFGMLVVYIFSGFIFSSMLLFMNINLGTSENYPVRGKVIDKYEFRGKGAEYRFTVFNQNDGKTYLFETTWREIDKYNKNDPFEKEMKKGLFGFIYSN